ncbi:hypothetical protein IJT10_04205 [bacterium]|nr:hypothetical protein [bacterium]
MYHKGSLIAGVRGVYEVTDKSNFATDPISDIDLEQLFETRHDEIKSKDFQEVTLGERLTCSNFTEKSRRLSRTSTRKSPLEVREETIKKKCRESADLQVKSSQDFDLETQKKCVELQRELSRASYQDRLREQERNFLYKKERVWDKSLLDNWPLILPLEIIREEHTKGSYVTLGVFLFKNNNNVDKDMDKFWNTEIYPLVEDDLNKWIEDNYLNSLGIKNIKFYTNSFRENVDYSSSLKTICYSMCSLPTIILECNVFPDSCNLSFTFWGLGDDPTDREYPKHLFCGEDYKLKNKDGYISEEEKVKLIDWICACFKMIIGCNFDAFRLAQYNEMPVFPQIAQTECDRELPNASLRYDELKKELTEFYKCIYDLFLGPKSNVAKDCKNNKLANVYALRLCYAERLKNFVEEGCLNLWLNDSIEAWCSLRGGKGAAKWLKGLLAGQYSRSKYFSDDDEDYFRELTSLMTKNNYLRSLCEETIKLLK